MRSYDRVAGMLFNTPLAVTAERAAVLAGLMTGWMHGEPRAATAGMPTEASRPAYTVDRGVAVVPITGTLVKRASWMETESGMQSYRDVVAAAEAAANDPKVGAILLQIDSPGGQVAGAFEAAAALREIGARKALWAIADSGAYSAAYLLASSAERIFVPETGEVGSIGVIAMRLDATEADAKLGMKWHIVQAGAQKAFGNPHTVMSENEMTVLSAKVAEVNQLFVETVAERRKMLPRAVAGLEAGTFRGEQARRIGLVDAVGTFDDAVAALAATLGGGAAVAVRGGKDMSMETETPVVAAAPAAEAPKVVPITDDPRIKAEIEAAVLRAKGDVAEVVALCAAFKCPERANAFVAEGKTRDQAFAILQAELVAKDAATATSGAHAGGEPEQPKTKIDADAYTALREQAIAEAHAKRPPVLVVA